MKITGITAEFNPLHNGHKYIMEEARRMTGADALVVAMSGDFVQRGEPAIISKHERARAALLSGADLVVEIPTLFCLGNASQYASASVTLLEACLADTIAFGSESGDTELIEETAANIKKNKKAIDDAIAELAKKGYSYPSAREKAYESVLKGSKNEEELKRHKGLLSKPNDILALEYVMNMNKARPLAIKRVGEAYDESEIKDGEFQSATAVRAAIFEEFDVEESGLKAYLPESSYDILKDAVLTEPEESFTLLQYAILSSDAKAIEDCPSAGEGLANLLIEAAKTAEDLDELIKHVKSKRYTYTRISRLCMQVILGIKRNKYPVQRPGYVRVLGFNDKGRELISAIKDRGDLPVITNINKEAEKLSEDAQKILALDVHAADIYNLISCREIFEESDHRLTPVII